MGVVVGEKITRAVEMALERAAAGDRRVVLGRRAHDGGRAVADADGQGLGGARPAGPREAALHLRPDGSDHRRRHGELRDAGRPEHRGAEGAHRLRRTAGDRADDPAEAARGLPAQRVPRRARHARPRGRSPRPEGDASRGRCDSCGPEPAPADRPWRWPARRRGAAAFHVEAAHAELLDRLFALETFGIKLGLENITRLCAALGHPERTFTSLHVAGTNGKGSVTAMAHAALVAAGVRAATVHVAASRRSRGALRHRRLRRWTPTASCGATCSTAPIGCGAERCGPPTFFEATTAIAFELFRRARVEVAVIEVGLGGRFDSTNVITPPAGAITSIGLDHQEHLGDTLAAIAFEKAGIIKPGMTVVAGAMPREARAVDRRGGRGARRARVIDAAADARVHGDVHGWARDAASSTLRTDRYGPVTLALRGEHQVGNALVAVRLLEAARRTGVWLPGERIERGLDRRRLAGAAGADRACRAAGRCCSTPPTTPTAHRRWPRTSRAGTPSACRW